MKNNIEEFQKEIRLLSDPLYSQKSPYDLSKIKRGKGGSKFCYYCKSKMLFNTFQEFVSTPDKAATIDHIYFKGDIRRALCREIVPCCRECNYLKNKGDYKWFQQGYEITEYIKASLFKIFEMDYSGNFKISIEEVENNYKLFKDKTKILINLRNQNKDENRVRNK